MRCYGEHLPGMQSEKKIKEISVADRRFLIVGGAGFIGSHFVPRLMNQKAATVTVYDNLSSGRRWHLEGWEHDPRLRIVTGDVADLDRLRKVMEGHEVVVHLASNPDIARAAKEPTIDFYQGTLLTQQVLEAMRLTGASRLLYASGSGVYGERGQEPLAEDDGPMLPISTYGASKLAGEAMIASYCAMFGLVACAFRFANVVGARQTHGVAFDFLRKLRLDPEKLMVLGNGEQSKPYIHVSDIISAVLLAEAQQAEGFAVYNVATPDALTVKEIVEMVLRSVSASVDTQVQYAGGERGWRGDVPLVRLRTERIRALGWEPVYSSREAMQRAITELLGDERSLWY